jgi:hypothetical protein
MKLMNTLIAKGEGMEISDTVNKGRSENRVKIELMTVLEYRN